MAQPNVTFTSGANATPINGIVVETLQVNASEHVQYILIGSKANAAKEWTFTSAQTNTVLLTASAAQQICVFDTKVMNAQSSAGDPGYRLGFTTTTLSAASASGVAGIIASHPGCPQGSGEVDPTCYVGAANEDVLFSCDAPIGTIRVVLKSITVTA